MAEFFTSGDYCYIVRDGNALITGYNGSDARVEVPAEIDGYKVTEIYNGAFEFCFNTEYISVPEGVARIDTGAFNRCNKLRELILPSTLEKLDYSAISECDSLVTVLIPETCCVAANSVISCSAFQRFTYPEGKDPNYEIDGVLFDKKTNKLVLYPITKTEQEYTIPDNITGIEAYAFSKNKYIRKVIIPESITSIDGHAFAYSAVEEVVLHDKLEIVEYQAFYESCLKSISLPESVWIIRSDAFAGTQIEEFSFPHKIHFAQNGLFKNCTQLRKVTFPPAIISIGSYAFYRTALEEIAIPASVTEMWGNAFSCCKLLRKVEMPAKTALPALEELGYTEDQRDIYETHRKTLLSIPPECFAHCDSLESISIPEGVAFIHDSSFYFCNNLCRVFIPLSVSKISSFSLGKGVTDIYYAGSESDWASINIDSGVKRNLADVNIHFNAAAIE